MPWHTPHLPLARGARAAAFHAGFCWSFNDTMALLQEIRACQADLAHLWRLVGISGAALIALLNAAGIAWVHHPMARVPAGFLAEGWRRIRRL